MNKFKAAPQSHIVPALKRIASALQSESITPEEVSYRLAMVRMALSQTAQQAVEAMGPIQADSREKVMDGFQKANPALTQDQLEEIADQWEKNKDQLKTAAVRSQSAKKRIKALDDLLAQFKELRKDFPDSPSILDSIRNIETERAQVASTLGKKQ